MDGTFHGVIRGSLEATLSTDAQIEEESEIGGDSQ
jgi:hypothetical protein